MNTYPLEDKICLISGGLGVMGLAVGDIVLKRGGKLIIADFQADGLNLMKSKLKEKSREDQYSYVRISSFEDLETAFDHGDSLFGKNAIDIFINFVEEIGESDWSRLYDVNIKGCHRGIQMGFERMGGSAAEGRGRVVLNLTSTMGVSCRGIMHAVPAFTASKHAITALTRTFGHDLYFNKTNVRVIAAAPTFIKETTMVSDNFGGFTEEEDNLKIIRDSVDATNSSGPKYLEPDEFALKIINILNAKNGSIWFMRPRQMQPINIPDNRLPN